MARETLTRPRSDKRRIVPKAGRPPEGIDAADVHPFRHAEFLTTAAQWSDLPVGGAPEIAFAGRSNAGKSSALNALAQHARLAFVSKTPGRTQHINFFRLRSGALLADLPGYGYAAVPAAIRRHWQTFVARYLAQRAELAGLVLTMDARHPVTELDRKMLDWFLPSGRPAHVLLTKADKLASAEQRRTLDRVHRAIDAHYAIHASRIGVQLFSATRAIGITEAEAAISAWLAVDQDLSAVTLDKERPRHQGE